MESSWRTQHHVRRTFTINPLLQYISWILVILSFPFARIGSSFARLILFIPLSLSVLALMHYGVPPRPAVGLGVALAIGVLFVPVLDPPIQFMVKFLKSMFMMFVVADPVGLVVASGVFTVFYELRGEFSRGVYGAIIVLVVTRIIYTVDYYGRSKANPLLPTKWFVATMFMALIPDAYFQIDFGSGDVNTQFNRAEVLAPWLKRPLGTHPYVSLPNISEWPLVTFRCTKPRNVSRWEKLVEVLPWFQSKFWIFRPEHLELEGYQLNRFHATLVAVFAEPGALSVDDILTFNPGVISPTADEIDQIFQEMVDELEDDPTEDDDSSDELDELFEEESGDEEEPSEPVIDQPPVAQEARPTSGNYLDPELEAIVDDLHRRYFGGSETGDES